MVSSSKIESLATRYAPYIDELREFFRSRAVPYGSPADLAAFADRLSDPSFCEEMASMTRSIVYRESETLPRTELMEVIAIAVGGTGIEDPLQDVHDALRQILAFVKDAARSPRADAGHAFPSFNTSIEEQAQLNASSVSQSHSGVETRPEHLTNDHLTRALVESEVHSGTSDDASFHQEQSRPQPAATPDHSSIHSVTADQPALATSEQTAENAQARDTSFPIEVAKNPALAVDPSRDVPSSDVDPKPPAKTAVQPAFQASSHAVRSQESFLRRAYWLPGLGALLVAALLVWFLRGTTHPRTSHTPQAAKITQALPTAQRPKPSAYGAPVRHSQREADAAGATQAASTTTLPLDPKTDSSEVQPTPALEHRSNPRRVQGSSAATTLLSGREGVFLASSGMMASHLISAPAPGYPKLARFTRVEGAVIVQVVVDRTGKVEATRVLDGPHLLRGAAEHAIRRWRYRPYLVDGRPTDVATIVTVTFRLHN